MSDWYRDSVFAEAQGRGSDDWMYWGESEPMDDACELCGVRGHLRVSVGDSVNLYVIEECGACGGERPIPRVLLLKEFSTEYTAPTQFAAVIDITPSMKYGGLTSEIPYLQNRTAFDTKTLTSASFGDVNMAIGNKTGVCALRHVARSVGTRVATVRHILKGHADYVAESLAVRADTIQPTGSIEWQERAVVAYCQLRDEIGHAPSVEEMKHFNSPHPLAAVCIKKVWGVSGLRKLRVAAGPPYPEHGFYGTKNKVRIGTTPT